MSLKVLILSHVSDYIGGAEKSLINIVDKWRDMDSSLEIEFILRTPFGGMEKELEARSIKYYGVDYTYWNDANLPDTPDRIYGNSIRNMRAVSAVEKIIKDSEPDVVLTNSIIAPWAALAAHFQGVPHVWMVREYGKRDHGRDFEIGEKETFEDIGNLSELVLANSLTLAKYIEPYLDRTKLSTVYTPFDIGVINKHADAVVKSPFRKSSQIKAMLIGNINPGKGHDLVVKALGDLKKRGIEGEAIFIGKSNDVKYADELKSLASKLKVSKSVHYLGFNSNPLAYAKHADIAIMASRMEAFGRVTFEYLAVGLPVIGSDSGATPELVIDGRNGFLYKPGDSSDLADKLVEYIENPELIKLHSDEARKHAELMMDSEFTAEKALDRIKELKGASKTKFKVLNYSKRWMQYPMDARKYMEYVNSAPLTGILKFRIKNKLRPHHARLKRVSSELGSKFSKGKNE